MVAQNCQLTVDLAAVQNNWLFLQKEIGSGVECGAVVKANAYGLGATEVATALFDKGCRTFFVASLQEALALPPQCADAATVMVFGGLRGGEESLCLENSITPVLSTLNQVERWAAACQKFEGDFNATLKVDTGMHRLGLTKQELMMLCEQRELLRACNPSLLMSHLACADEPAHMLNETQLNEFESSATMVREIIPAIKLSLANSSGVFLGSKYHYDIVRPGASLYGVNPTPDKLNPMSSVVTLKLPIMQIKKVRDPASVGYGASYKIPAGEEVVLAIVLGGYGDGVYRSLSNRGYGVVAGQKVPLVGKVSMDTIIFNVTRVQASLLEESDSITIIGGGVDGASDYISVDDMADSAGTIGYEMLTALGNRYARHYVK